jgi:hypothetical protein
MADVKICACGIAADDCDYHKPVPESEPKTLKFIPGTGVRLTEDDSEITPFLGTVDLYDPKMALVIDVAKRVGDWYYQEQMKAFVGVFGRNDVG